MNQEQLKLKKGKKVKLKGEEFIVEEFKDKGDEKEIILRNEDFENPKLIRQKAFMKKEKDSEHAGVYREVKSANKFDDGFSFQSHKVFVGKSIIKNNKNKNN